MTGIVYLLEGDRRKAWRHLAKASLGTPSWPESKIMLAQVTAEDGAYEEALGWLRKGLQDMESPARKWTWIQWPIFASLNRFETFRQLKQRIEREAAAPALQPRPERTANRPACFELGDLATETLPPALDVKVKLKDAPPDGD